MAGRCCVLCVLILNCLERAVTHDPLVADDLASSAFKSFSREKKSVTALTKAISLREPPLQQSRRRPSASNATAECKFALLCNFSFHKRRRNLPTRYSPCHGRCRFVLEFSWPTLSFSRHVLHFRRPVLLRYVLEFSWPVLNFSRPVLHFQRPDLFFLLYKVCFLCKGIVQRARCWQLAQVVLAA